MNGESKDGEPIIAEEFPLKLIPSASMALENLRRLTGLNTADACNRALIFYEAMESARQRDENGNPRAHETLCGIVEKRKYRLRLWIFEVELFRRRNFVGALKFEEE